MPRFISRLGVAGALGLSLGAAWVTLTPQQMRGGEWREISGGDCKCEDNTISTYCQGAGCGTHHSCQGEGGADCESSDYCTTDGCTIVHGTDCT